jgi:hypothetical protein
MLINCLQEVTQSVGIAPNEAEVTSSNPPAPLVRTCQKKNANKLICFYQVKLPFCCFIINLYPRHKNL